MLWSANPKTYSESCEVKDSPSIVDVTCELLPE